MAATNIHPVQPIVEVVETVGEKPPWSKTHTKRPGAKKLEQNIHETYNQKKATTEKPKKKPNREKNQKKNPNLWKKHQRKPSHRKGL